MATSRTSLAGGALTVLSLVGYGFGLASAYPGRAFSLTGLMVGLTLLALGGDGGRQRGGAND